MEAITGMEDKIGIKLDPGLVAWRISTHLGGNFIKLPVGWQIIIHRDLIQLKMGLISTNNQGELFLEKKEGEKVLFDRNYRNITAVQLTTCLGKAAIFLNNNGKPIIGVDWYTTIFLHQELAKIIRRIVR